MLLDFTKMHGLGNDFIVFDAPKDGRLPTVEQWRALAARHTGIGFDQALVLEPPRRSGTQVYYRIFNADGGEVEQCGNGVRCLASFLHRRGALSNPGGNGEIVLDSPAGAIRARVHDANLISVDMGVPKFGWRDIPLAEEFRDTRAIELQIGPIDKPVLHSPSVVNVGNPHAIFWVDDVHRVDLAKAGPLLENHPIFPERANITLAHVTAADAITIRTWERGVGLTRACGTAACATLVSAARTRRSGRASTITLPGGTLHIEWDERDHIWMTGPAELEFSGMFDPQTGAFSRDA